MEHNFGLAMRALRRRSGLSQADLAHLLQVKQSRVSRLESGVFEPTASELCALRIIYGQALGKRFETTIEDMKQRLRERLETIPQCPKHWRNRAARRTTLNALSRRLEASLDGTHGT